MRSSPSATLIGSPRCRSRPPGPHPGGLAATKRVSFSDPLVSSPSSPVPPQNGPGTVFLPGEEVFARLGPAASSQPPQTWYLSRQRAPPKRLDLWTSSLGQSSGGALRRAAYAPGDGQTNLEYSSNPVQFLYIRCYVIANKPVLSYLLLRILPHYHIIFLILML